MAWHGEAWHGMAWHGITAPATCTCHLPLFTTRYTHYSLLTAQYIHCLLLTCTLFTTHSYSLLTALCSLLTTHCSLLTAHCRDTSHRCSDYQWSLSPVFESRECAGLNLTKEVEWSRQ